MLKTLKITFVLKNTYAVNAILYSLRQIPLLKRLLPAELYGSRYLKTFANILFLLYEICTVFLGKACYFILLSLAVKHLYAETPASQALLHMLLFLSIGGTVFTDDIIRAERSDYYATHLLRMDAKAYILINYFYALTKTVIGFLPFTIIYGTLYELLLWFSLVLPLCIIALKITVTAINLQIYLQKGGGYKENPFYKRLYIFLFFIVMTALLPPFYRVVLPANFYIAAFLICLPIGLVAVTRVLNFGKYTQLNKEVIFKMNSSLHNLSAGKLLTEISHKDINADTTLVSTRQGFEFLNELFIKRHKKILWQKSFKLIYFYIFIFSALIISFYLFPDIKASFRTEFPLHLSYVILPLYIFNSGKSFTQALFMNCDHSLLTYSCFKQAHFILQLFTIRLREIIKINGLPATVFACAAATAFFVAGGSTNPLDYALIIIAVICISVIFSVHALTLYYLLQPYNTATEMVSATYSTVEALTAPFLMALWKVQIPLVNFCLAAFGGCLLYSFIACLLVYRLAPRTFKLKT